jgi:hypothetical protein
MSSASDINQIMSLFQSLSQAMRSGEKAARTATTELQIEQLTQAANAMRQSGADALTSSMVARLISMAQDLQAAGPQQAGTIIGTHRAKSVPQPSKGPPQIGGHRQSVAVLAGQLEDALRAISQRQESSGTSLRA